MKYTHESEELNALLGKKVTVTLNEKEKTIASLEFSLLCTLGARGLKLSKEDVSYIAGWLYEDGYRLKEDLAKFYKRQIKELKRRLKNL